MRKQIFRLVALLVILIFVLLVLYFCKFEPTFKVLASCATLIAVIGKFLEKW